MDDHNLTPFQPSPRFRDADPLHDLTDWERDWLRGYDSVLDRLAARSDQILIPTAQAPTVLPDPPIAPIEGDVVSGPWLSAPPSGDANRQT